MIRVNVSLTDINRFAEMDAIYCEYFSEPYPTRNTIGVKELWGGETKMKAGCAEGNNGADDDRAAEGLEANGGAAAILARFERIGAEREVRAMRFGCADGQQQHIGLRQRRLDFGSGHFVKSRRTLL